MRPLEPLLPAAPLEVPLYSVLARARPLLDGHCDVNWREPRQADVILLLVSADFMASDYIWGKELEVAMELHEAGEARVIPVILRPVDWTGAPFSRLQSLPKDGRPVVSWPSRDEAFVDVARGIRLVLE